ncbi:MAG: VIT1/CCC1 transporter family protein, partial [Pseudomonadota bacterium]
MKSIRGRITAPKDRKTLRSAVYGGIDGGVTTFAIVSGVAGAGLADNVIIILGVANVLADGFSMAAGDYLATKSDGDNLKRIKLVEERHIRTHPEGEKR